MTVKATSRQPGEAVSAPGQDMELRVLRLSTGAPCGDIRGAAWFEHDQQTVARHVLMACAHLTRK